MLLHATKMCHLKVTDRYICALSKRSLLSDYLLAKGRTVLHSLLSIPLFLGWSGSFSKSYQLCVILGVGRSNIKMEITLKKGEKNEISQLDQSTVVLLDEKNLVPFCVFCLWFSTHIFKPMWMALVLWTCITGISGEIQKKKKKKKKKQDLLTRVQNS